MTVLKILLSLSLYSTYVRNRLNTNFKDSKLRNIDHLSEQEEHNCKRNIACSCHLFA